MCARVSVRACEHVRVCVCLSMCAYVCVYVIFTDTYMLNIYTANILSYFYLHYYCNIKVIVIHTSAARHTYNVLGTARVSAM